MQSFLERRFAAALQNLWMEYQPILTSSRKQIYAYEALMRSRVTGLRRPLDLLLAAQRLGREHEHELGRVVRRRVANDLSLFDADRPVFVNIEAGDLEDPELLSSTAALGPHSDRVVFEITERQSLAGVAGLAMTLAALRERGYRLALDDFGTAYSDEWSVAQVQPEYLKLDLSLIHGIDLHAPHRAQVEAIVEASRRCGRKVVGEGVERVSEAEILHEMGCDLLQGHLLSWPGRGTPGPLKSARRTGGAPLDYALAGGLGTW